MDDCSQVLGDLGERQIVQKMIMPRFPAMATHSIGLGDDCAAFPPPPVGQLLVWTVDPCPTPVSCLIGNVDYYHYGWMTVLINVSDLAAMGAQPIGLLVSTVMRNDMLVRDYERFLDGLVDASQEWDCPVIGGNIKDGDAFSATGTGLGTVAASHLMSRTGARPDDLVCVVGDMGVFWSAVLARGLAGLDLDHHARKQLEDALLLPRPKLVEGIELAKTGCVTTCMDSSDGITACLDQLASANHMDVIVEADHLVPLPSVKEIAHAAQIDVRKLMLSWGDWQLVCTVRSGCINAARDSLQRLGADLTVIGRIVRGNGSIWLQESGHLHRLRDFSSQRFADSSMFTHGLEPFIDYLRFGELTAD